MELKLVMVFALALSLGIFFLLFLRSIDLVLKNSFSWLGFSWVFLEFVGPSTFVFMVYKFVGRLKLQWVF